MRAPPFPDIMIHGAQNSQHTLGYDITQADGAAASVTTSTAAASTAS
jgi:hypothetical protein